MDEMGSTSIPVQWRCSKLGTRYVLKSRSEKPFSPVAKGLVIVVGLGLVSYSIRTFFSFEMNQLARTFPYALMGLFCLFIAGFEKGVSLSADGITKVYKSWGTSGKKVIPWKDVKKVSAKENSSNVMATFRTITKSVNAEFTNLGPEDLLKIINVLSPETEVESF